jgi:hypothetical protein
MDNPRPLLDHLEKITVPPTLSSSEWNDRWHRIFSEFLLELEHTPTEDLISAFATSQALYHSLEQESLFSVHLAFEILGTEQSQINTSQALFIYYLVKLSEIPLIRTIYLKPYEQYQQHFLTHPEDASEHLNTFNSFSDLIYLGFNLSEMYRSMVGYCLSSGTIFSTRRIPVP